MDLRIGEAPAQRRGIKVRMTVDHSSNPTKPTFRIGHRPRHMDNIKKETVTLMEKAKAFVIEQCRNENIDCSQHLRCMMKMP